MATQNITAEISDWLERNSSNISPDEFVKGAELLLRCNANKLMFNYMIRNKTSVVVRDKLVYELKKFHKIQLSSVTLKQVEELRPKIEDIGNDIEDQPKLTDKQEQKSYKGKREDHDDLPEHIQAIYEVTLNLLHKERQLHEKLKLMDDAPACDRHEFTTQLCELDKKRCEAWEQYDHFDLEKYNAEKKQREEKSANILPADAARTIFVNRTYISKAIRKLEAMKDDELKIAEYKELLAKVQEKYEISVKLGANFKESYKEELSKAGLTV